VFYSFLKYSAKLALFSGKRIPKNQFMQNPRHFCGVLLFIL